MDWDTLQQEAKEIIVFGSFAVSANRPSSDVDVLCVGHGKRFKSPKLHLIWVSEERIRSTKWAGSELAAHVSAYGKWIKGRNTWAHRTKPSSASIARKKNNIIARVDAMQRHWNELLPTFQNSQILKLRRDLQRYRMMRRGLAPVPKSLLDAEWNQRCEDKAWIALIEANRDLAPKVKKFLQARGTASNQRGFNGSPGRR